MINNQKATRKLQDIKLIIGISNATSTDSLQTMIINSLELAFEKNSFEANSRFRLHPYVILPAAGVSKSDNNLSSNDVTVLEALKPLLVQLRESVQDVFYLDKTE